MIKGFNMSDPVDTRLYEILNSSSIISIKQMRNFRLKNGVVAKLVRCDHVTTRPAES